uniref:Uncharacterized protein n=1 Tax=Brassica oleracea var. oleracea TaxID=109376 RepID=A0A0D3AUF9_BRAOL
MFVVWFNNYDKYGLLCGADRIRRPEALGRVYNTRIFVPVHRRMDRAQTEAVNLLCGAKTKSNPENTVGMLTMVGLDVGEFNLTTAIQIAQLAFKHCQNKNQRERIIVFAGRSGYPRAIEYRDGYLKSGYLKSGYLKSGYPKTTIPDPDIKSTDPTDPNPDLGILNFSDIRIRPRPISNC